MVQQDIGVLSSFAEDVALISSFVFFFFFKQKTAYEMRISDWSSDVCSSDLTLAGRKLRLAVPTGAPGAASAAAKAPAGCSLATPLAAPLAAPIAAAGRAAIAEHRLQAAPHFLAVVLAQLRVADIADLRAQLDADRRPPPPPDDRRVGNESDRPRT